MHEFCLLNTLNKTHLIQSTLNMLSNKSISPSIFTSTIGSFPSLNNHVNIIKIIHHNVCE